MVPDDDIDTILALQPQTPENLRQQPWQKTKVFGQVA
jgi:hypothetical protein